MNKKKAFSFLLALLLLIITFSIKDVNAAESFKMEMNTTKSVGGGEYDIHVKVTNNGSDFTGTLRVIVTNKNYNRVGYDIDISIPKNAEKEYTVSVPVKGVMTNESVQGVILDKSKKNKFSQSFRGVLNQYSGYIEAGILSDHPGDLSFLDLGGKKIGNDTANQKIIKLKELSADNLKDELDNLQMLIIDDYDTTTINSGTMARIEDWNRNGGMLLLGTGNAALKVLSGFDKNYIDVTYNDVSSVSIPSASDTSSTFEIPYAIIDPGTAYEYKSEGLLLCSVSSGSMGIIPYKLADFKDHTNEVSSFLMYYYNDLLSYRADVDVDYVAPGADASASVRFTIGPRFYF